MNRTDKSFLSRSLLNFLIYLIWVFVKSTLIAKWIIIDEQVEKARIWDDFFVPQLLGKRSVLFNDKICNDFIW